MRRDGKGIDSYKFKLERAAGVRKRVFHKGALGGVNRNVVGGKKNVIPLETSQIRQPRQKRWGKHKRRYTKRRLIVVQWLDLKGSTKESGKGGMYRTETNLHSDGGNN